MLSGIQLCLGEGFLLLCVRAHACVRKRQNIQPYFKRADCSDDCIQSAEQECLRCLTVLQHSSGCSLTVAGWQTADKSVVPVSAHNEHSLCTASAV